MAAHFTDDQERGKVMAFQLSGCGLGVIMGPPIGGIVYGYFGKTAPFIALSFMALITAVLQAAVFHPIIIFGSDHGCFTGLALLQSLLGSGPKGVDDLCFQT